MKNIYSIFGLSLSLSLTLASCATFRYPASEKESPDYQRIFQTTRQLYRDRLDNKDDPALKNLKKVPESDLVAFFQHDPERFNEAQAQLLESIRTESKNVDPTKHLRLLPPKGTWGYENLIIHISHHYYENNKLMPPQNLVKVWKDFLSSAQHEIVLNVFDFDLEEIADALIQKVRSGVKVRVGIDKGVIDARPGVKAVYQKLLSGGVTVTPVKSVGLNHQKMASIDWNHVDKARVLFS